MPERRRSRRQDVAPLLLSELTLTGPPPRGPTPRLGVFTAKEIRDVRTRGLAAQPTGLLVNHCDSPATDEAIYFHKVATEAISKGTFNWPNSRPGEPALSR